MESLLSSTGFSFPESAKFSEKYLYLITSQGSYVDLCQKKT